MLVHMNEMSSNLLFKALPQLFVCCFPIRFCPKWQMEQFKSRIQTAGITKIVKITLFPLGFSSSVGIIEAKRPCDWGKALPKHVAIRHL